MSLEYLREFVEEAPFFYVVVTGLVVRLVGRGFVSETRERQSTVRFVLGAVFLTLVALKLLSSPPEHPLDVLVWLVRAAGIAFLISTIVAAILMISDSIACFFSSLLDRTRQLFRSIGAPFVNLLHQMARRKRDNGFSEKHTPPPLSEKQLGERRNKESKLLAVRLKIQEIEDAGLRDRFDKLLSESIEVELPSAILDERITTITDSISNYVPTKSARHPQDFSSMAELTHHFATLRQDILAGSHDEHETEELLSLLEQQRATALHRHIIES